MNKQMKELQETLNTLHSTSCVDMPLDKIPEYKETKTYYLGQVVKANNKVYLYYTIAKESDDLLGTPEYLKPYWKEINYKQLGETN